MTRTNVQAGPAGFYLLRGGPDDLPQGGPNQLPAKKYEIPIVIQDRSFNNDGSLFYPNSRFFFDGYGGPYVPDTRSDISPIWNPEFFGNTMVVNGKTWPYLNVEPRKYRFRFLNGTDSRFLILKFTDGNVKTDFTVIGTEGGFLPAPVVQPQILIGPAERFDTVVDFSKFKAGDVIHLINIGPDEPFGGAFPNAVIADPNTTGQVMELRVVPFVGRPDRSAVPALPPITPVGTPTNIRQVSLNELESDLVCVDRNNVYTTPVSFNPLVCARRSVPLGPLEARLGTFDPTTGVSTALQWMAPITEDPGLGATEEWEIYNFTADAHPIHIHMVMFQVVNRQVIGGAVRPPEPWETGFKDTVASFPGEITRVKAVYDIGGLFVWHCHILSHEDNEMMRPYCVGGGCQP
jgi:FtsP/CotA-like multicopper oxidase with cupredoxin domain